MPRSGAGIPYWYTKPDVQAQCWNCGATWSDKNAKGVAARHAQATGHVVCVDETRSFIYGEEHPGENPNSPYGAS